MNGLVAARRARICVFGHDDFPYKLKLLEGVSSSRPGRNVEERGKRDGSASGDGGGGSGERANERNKRIGETESEGMGQIGGG